MRRKYCKLYDQLVGKTWSLILAVIATSFNKFKNRVKNYVAFHQSKLHISLHYYILYRTVCTESISWDIVVNTDWSRVRKTMKWMNLTKEIEIHTKLHEISNTNGLMKITWLWCDKLIILSDERLILNANIYILLNGKLWYFHSIRKDATNKNCKLILDLKISLETYYNRSTPFRFHPAQLGWTKFLQLFKTICVSLEVLGAYKCFRNGRNFSILSISLCWIYSMYFFHTNKGNFIDMKFQSESVLW